MVTETIKVLVRDKCPSIIFSNTGESQIVGKITLITIKDPYGWECGETSGKFKAVEICVDNIKSAINAYNGGSRRIELCSSLFLGGLTPSIGLLKIARKTLPLDCLIFVMVRPTPKEDHVYDESEINIMIEDIEIFKKNGADGFVFGCLDKNKNIDVISCSKLLKAADNFPCTFHRAFDIISLPFEGLLTLINLGFSRILTSGQEKSAYLGRHLIRQLVLKAKEYNSSLIIMAGGGINLNNLQEILDFTKVTECHGSARANISTTYDPKNSNFLTDEITVRKMVEIFKSFN